MTTPKSYMTSVIDGLKTLTNNTDTINSLYKNIDYALEGSYAGFSGKDTPESTLINRLIELVDYNNPDEVNELTRIFYKCEFMVKKLQVKKVAAHSEKAFFELLYNNLDSKAPYFVEDKEQLDRYFQFRQQEHGGSVRYSHIDTILDDYLNDLMSSENITDIHKLFEYLRSIFSESVLNEIFNDESEHTLRQSKLARVFTRVVNLLFKNYDDNFDGVETFKNLSHEDKEFLCKALRKIDYHGGWSSKIEEYRSLNLLYTTFYLDSNSHYFKEKTLASKIYAIWYICKKQKQVKYLSKFLGKWDNLPRLYNYNFNKVISVLKAGAEFQAAFDNLDIDY